MLAFLQWTEFKTTQLPPPFPITFLALFVGLAYGFAMTYMPQIAILYYSQINTSSAIE